MLKSKFSLTIMVMEDLEKRLTELFSEEKKSTEKMIDILTIIVFDKFEDNLGKLYKIVGMEKFSQIIDLFSSKTINFPSADEFKKALTLAMVYYYKRVCGYDWDKVQKELPYAKDVGLHYGKSIIALDSTIQKHLNSILGANNKKDDSIFGE